MGGIFSPPSPPSPPPPPPPDPELERRLAESEAAAEDARLKEEERKNEEQLAIKRRMRGSRSLFSGGYAGFTDDEAKTTTLGG